MDFCRSRSVKTVHRLTWVPVTLPALSKSSTTWWKRSRSGSRWNWQVVIQICEQVTFPSSYFYQVALLFVYLYLCCVHVFMYLYMYVWCTDDVWMCLSIDLSVCVSIYLYICLCSYLSIYLPISASIVALSSISSCADLCGVWHFNNLLHWFSSHFYCALIIKVLSSLSIESKPWSHQTKCHSWWTCTELSQWISLQSWRTLTIVMCIVRASFEHRFARSGVVVLAKRLNNF